MLPLFTSVPDAAGAATADDTDTDWEDIAYAEFVGEAMGGPPEPYTQRMVRCGDWKLSYYHQFSGAPYHRPYQLFNLVQDPDETDDRAQDPSCAAVVCTVSARDR